MGGLLTGVTICVALATETTGAGGGADGTAAIFIIAATLLGITRVTIAGAGGAALFTTVRGNLLTVRVDTAAAGGGVLTTWRLAAGAATDTAPLAATGTPLPPAGATIRFFPQLHIYILQRFLIPTSQPKNSTNRQPLGQKVFFMDLSSFQQNFHLPLKRAKKHICASLADTNTSLPLSPFSRFLDLRHNPKILRTGNLLAKKFSSWTSPPFNKIFICRSREPKSPQTRDPSKQKQSQSL
jgi:hypothetical protein